MVWELSSVLCPLTSLFRIHTMIAQPRLHDITTSLNAHMRIELKIPHGYRLTAVSSKHQLHSQCSWERRSGYSNSRLLRDEETYSISSSKIILIMCCPVVYPQMFSAFEPQRRLCRSFGFTQCA